MKVSIKIIWRKKRNKEDLSIKSSKHQLIKKLKKILMMNESSILVAQSYNK